MSRLSVLVFGALLASSSGRLASAERTTIPAGQSTSGQNTPSQTNGDIPKQKPGTNNPDISPDAKPASGTDTNSKKTKKSKHRKNSSSTHTAPTS